MRDDIGAARVSAYRAQNVVFQVEELVAFLQNRPFESISNIDLYRRVWSMGYRPFAFNRAALHDTFTAATDAERFHEAFPEFPSTELYQRIKQDDLGLVATDVRDLQEMANVLISYRSDLWPRPDFELPKLMVLAQELIGLIETEYPEE